MLVYAQVVNYSCKISKAVTVSKDKQTEIIIHYFTESGTQPCCYRVASKKVSSFVLARPPQPAANSTWTHLSTCNANTSGKQIKDATGAAQLEKTRACAMTTAAASVKDATRANASVRYSQGVPVLISASDCDTQIVGTVQENDGEEQ